MLISVSPATKYIHVCSYDRFELRLWLIVSLIAVVVAKNHYRRDRPQQRFHGTSSSLSMIHHAQENLKACAQFRMLEFQTSLEALHRYTYTCTTLNHVLAAT